MECPSGKCEDMGVKKDTRRRFEARNIMSTSSPKIKLEMVVPSSRVEDVTRALAAAARSGSIGDGKIFVSDVAEAIRIRNDERGDAAL
jgi:nitrogen regulatory protein P-II 1